MQVAMDSVKPSEVSSEQCWGIESVSDASPEASQSSVREGLTTAVDDDMANCRSWELLPLEDFNCTGVEGWCSSHSYRGDWKKIETKISFDVREWWVINELTN